MLICPSERTNAPATDGNAKNSADEAHRSYIINGWNDYFFDTLSLTDFDQYMAGAYPNGLKTSAIVLTSDTIVLGEKASDRMDYFMDLLEGSGNDFSGVAEESRHDGRGPGTETGGSNYVFADGSVRFLKCHASLYPLNLWAITDKNRKFYVVVP